MIDAPKPRLKALQRRLLDEVLAHLPSHPAAHDLRRGRSVATYAAPHAGEAVVVRMHPAHWRLGRRLAAPHLPQGAPSSPVLADLAAYKLDAQLAGVARSWRRAYTRYADDLALSGDRGARCPPGRGRRAGDR